MFPDVEVAKTCVSGRTKTNVLVETLVCDDSNYIDSQLENQPFGVAIDPYNYMDNTNLYPVTVRYVYLRFYMGDNMGFTHIGNWTKMIPTLAAVLFFLRFLVESVYVIHNTRICMFFFGSIHDDLA